MLKKLPYGSKQGVSETGDKFLVPPTRSVVQNLYYGENWSVPSMISIFIALLELELVLFGGLSHRVNVAICIFWRCCYNVGLGYLLYYQSKRKLLTRIYESMTKDPGSRKSRFAKWFASSSMPSTYNCDDYPSSYNAWLSFRHVADFVLVNDSWSTLLLGYKCFNSPSEIDFLLILQYIVGISLFAFNYWAKVDAHRQIGEYCWYWGDFFFRVEQNLTFDGVFELFPHPMYTVGYSLYYGMSLLCRSYTMFLTCVVCHISQIAFLIIVENPHIERLYGAETRVDKKTQAILYDKSTGFFQEKKETITFWNIDLFNSADLALVIFGVYGVGLSFLVENKVWCVVQVALWKLLHWIGTGSILYGQAREKMWTRHFKTLNEAFEHWKKTYNLSLTMNHVVFVCCTLRHFHIPTELTKSFVASLIGGCVLIAINIYSSTSAYNVIGDFGWFYGDFFIPRKKYQSELRYTGIYRYLNNPDCVTGHAGLYGLALMSRSYTMLGLAVFAQFMNIIFVNVIEVPHMKRIYGAIRHKNPTQKAVKNVIQKGVQKFEQEIDRKQVIRKRTNSFRERSRSVRGQATHEIFELYKKMSEAITNGRIEGEQPVEIKPEVSSVRIGEELRIRFKTNVSHSTEDWIGVYPFTVPSAPGLSKGFWCRVPEGAMGEVVLPPGKLPNEAGVYEVRYHVLNTYNAVAACPIEFIHSNIKTD